MFSPRSGSDDRDELYRSFRRALRSVLATFTFIHFRLLVLVVVSLSFVISGGLSLSVAGIHKEIAPSLKVLTAVTWGLGIVSGSALCAGICPLHRLRFNMSVGAELIWTLAMSPISILTASLAVQTLSPPPTSWDLSHIPEANVEFIPLETLRAGYTKSDKRARLVVVWACVGAGTLVLYTVLLTLLAFHENSSSLRQGFVSSSHTSIYRTYIHRASFHRPRSQLHSRYHPTQLHNGAGYPVLFSTIPSILELLALVTREPFWAYGDTSLSRWSMRPRWLQWHHSGRNGGERRHEEGAEEGDVLESAVESEEVWGGAVARGRDHERVCVRLEGGGCSCGPTKKSEPMSSQDSPASQRLENWSGTIDNSTTAQTQVDHTPIPRAPNHDTLSPTHVHSRHRPIARPNTLLRQRSASAPLSLGMAPSHPHSGASSPSYPLSPPISSTTQLLGLPTSHSYAFGMPMSRSGSLMRLRKRFPPPLMALLKSRASINDTSDSLPEITHRRVDPSEYVTLSWGSSRGKAKKTGSNNADTTLPCSGALPAIPRVASLVRIPTEGERRRIFVAFEV